MIRTFTFLCFSLLVSTFACSQVIPIEDARSKAEGTTVTVEGLVTNGDEFGIIRYFQDQTGGLAAYGSQASALQPGDSIRITGTLKNYNELLEIDPISSVTVLSSNNPLPQPEVTTLPQGFAEQYESQLVRFNDVTFQASGTFQGGTNYTVLQSGVEKEIRINSGTDLVGQPIPQGVVDIQGIMSEYSPVWLGTTYQLLLRGQQDIILSQGPVIASELMVEEINPRSLRLSFTTQEDGTTIFRYGTTKALTGGTETDATLTTTHTATIDGLEPATFYYVQALSVGTTGDTSFSSIGYFSTASLSTGKIHVFFNRSVAQDVFPDIETVTLNRVIDDTLATYIGRAKQSIDLALYNLNSNGLSANLSTAINKAFDRGVQVRIIADGSTAQIGLQELRPGIPVLRTPTSAGYGIMHNKFIIIDGKSQDPNEPLVWTGSTNLTGDQINVDANSVVVIQDQAVAKAYLMEFEEMWGSTNTTPNASQALFGPDKKDNTPHFFSVNGDLIELYFSPSDNTNAEIIEAIVSADAQLFFATLVFTREDVAQAIIAQSQAGVTVKGVMEENTAASEDIYNMLSPVLNQNLLIEQTTDQLHHKYTVIDPLSPHLDPLVVVGSHNWSTSAEEQNDENTLIIHSETIAAMYFEEWLQRFRDAGGQYTPVGLPEEEPVHVLVQTLQQSGQPVRVQLTAPAQQQVQARLVSMSGQTLSQAQWEVSQGTNTRHLPLPQVSSGMYLLVLEVDGVQKPVKIIVQ